jgi:hypothetical protein
MEISKKLSALKYWFTILIFSFSHTGCKDSEANMNTEKINISTEKSNTYSFDWVDVEEYKRMICRDTMILISGYHVEEVQTCITFTLLNEPCLEKIEDPTIKHFRITNFTLDKISINSLFFNGNCWIKKQKTGSIDNTAWPVYLNFKTHHLEYSVKIEPASKTDFEKRFMFMNKLSSALSSESPSVMDYEEWFIEVLFDGKYNSYLISDVDVDPNVREEILEYLSF